MKNIYVSRKTFSTIDELIKDAEKIGMKFKVEESTDGVNQVATIRFYQCGESTLIAGYIYKTFDENLEECFYAGWHGID